MTDNVHQNAQSSKIGLKSIHALETPTDARMAFTSDVQTWGLAVRGIKKGCLAGIMAEAVSAQRMAEARHGRCALWRPAAVVGRAPPVHRSPPPRPSLAALPT